MTTLEKLFVQIFERKNRIIQQVKQQTDLYNQNLTSKLLIDGIDPPSWLWNPNKSSEDSQKVLNKEELISEIFLPRQQPPVGFLDSRYYLCNQSVAQGTGDILDGSINATYACSNVGTEAKQSRDACSEENNAGCGINTVPEVEVSVTSPEDETELRISNMYATQEQSLVRIQRSKSRQKALEIRTSEKAKEKTSKQESALAGSSAQGRLLFFRNKMVDLVDGMDNLAEPFVISRESCEVEELKKSDGWKKEEQIVVPSGKCRSARNSVAETCLSDALKADCSDYTQDKNGTGQQCNKDIPTCQGSDNELMEDFDTLNVSTDSCGGVYEERAGGWGADKGNDTNTSGGRILTSSYSQQPCFLSEAPELNKLIHAARSEEGVVSKSVGCLVQLSNDATESCNLNEPSSGVAHDITSLKTSLCNNGLATLSDNPCSGPREQRSESSSGYGIVNSAKCNSSAVNGDKIMPTDFVKNLPLNSNFTSESAKLEYLTKISSGCLRSVYPTQLNFDDTAGCNLNETSCISLQSKGQEISAKDVSDDSYCDPFWTAQENVLLEGQKSFGKSEHQIGSSGSAHLKEYKLSGNHYTNFKTGQDNSEILHVLSSTPVHEAKHGLIAFQTSSTENQIDVLSKEGCKFIPELQIEYQRTAERKKKNTSLPCDFEREHLESDYHEEKDDLSMLGSVVFSFGEDNDLDSLKSTEIQYPEEKLQSVKEYSWPKNKRRKIKDQETSSFSASPSFRIRRKQTKVVDLNSNLGGENETVLEQPTTTTNCTGDQIYPKVSCQLDSLKSMETQYPEKLQSVRGYSWPLNKRRKMEDQETISFSASPSFRIRREQTKAVNFNLNSGDENETVQEQSTTEKNRTSEQIYPKIKTMEFSAETISNEGRLYSEVLTENQNISPSPNLNQVEDSILSPSFKEIGGVSQGCSRKELDLVYGRSYIVRENQKNGLDDEALVNTEGLVDADSTILNAYCFDANSQPSDNLVPSPAIKDLGMIGVDQTMPVLEGFIMNSVTFSENFDFSGSEITFDELELPRTSIERASILEQICKSASMQTPFSQITSAFKFQGMHTCDLSLPNGLLECANMKSFSASDGNLYNHIRSQCVDETIESFHVTSHSDCSPYAKSRYAWDVRNPFISPVGKLWEKNFMHSDSSGKKVSSNPELTCFRIEEDPDHSEENDDILLPDKVNDNIDTGVYNCTEREPLADIRAVYSYGTSSVPVAEKHASKCNSNPVATEVSFKRSHNKFKGKAGKHSKSRTDEKENDILLTGTNRMKKGDDSQNNRYSKISSTYSTSSRTEQCNLLKRETKQNNIVSNVSSFIPLVQQKQDAARCRGAGKRDIKVKALEAAEATKRQQEKRDQERKLRKEELKLERARVEREMRLTELNKKKKEEKNKKKDAEIVAKKRARDEEERKEKERKRKRMEEARSQRMEEGKIVSDKVDKEKHLSIMVTPAIMKKTANINNSIQKIQEKSYEISPYQCSDDEDDDDNDRSKNKYRPSWASESRIALVLPLQQDIDLESIFPPNSFCSTSEVAIPRKHM